MNVLDQFSLKGKVIAVFGHRGRLGSLAMQVIAQLDGTALGFDLPDCDIADYANLARNRSLSHHQTIHGCINCAVGNQAPTSPAQAGAGTDIQIGLVGAINTLELFRPLPGGSFVLVGSELSFKAPNPERYGKAFKPAAYSAIKHGLVGLAKYYAALWASHQIRVNILCPGPIENGQAAYPGHRMAKLHELAGPIAFLLSDASSFMTGAELKVDGGATAW